MTTLPLHPDIQQLIAVNARVYAMVAADCHDDTCPIQPVLDQCVEEAVLRYWSQATVTIFVPLLAVREVRECIRRGTCADPARTATV